MTYVILAAQGISQPSTEKLLIGIDSDQQRNQELNKVQRIRDFRILSLEGNIILHLPTVFKKLGNNCRGGAERMQESEVMNDCKEAVSSE